MNSLTSRFGFCPLIGKARPLRCGVAFAMLLAVAMLSQNQHAIAQSLDQPLTRLRPLGAPSAVDQYKRPPQTSTPVTQASFPQQAPPTIRRAAWMQNATADGGFSFPGGAMPNPQPSNPGVAPPVLPNDNLALPPGGASGNLGASVPSTAPRGLPAPTAVPNTFPSDVSGNVASPSDLMQMPQPQLGGFATANNCNLVTGPSYYSAASGFGCGCGQVLPTSYNAAPTGQYIAPTNQIAAPAVMPPVGAPISQFQTGLGNPTTGAPVPSLITLGQQRFPVQVGQGLWGQPKAYVPGQGFRNWIRYFFP